MCIEVAVSSKDKRGRISFEIQDNGPGIPSIGSRRIDASSLVRHEGSNLAIATNEIRDLGGASFAQNVVNGDTGRIKGLRITAVFPRQPKE
jgi:K+-sensing histidine kinase KdpD